MSFKSASHMRNHFFINVRIYSKKNHALEMDEVQRCGNNDEKINITNKYSRNRKSRKAKKDGMRESSFFTEVSRFRTFLLIIRITNLEYVGLKIVFF